MTDLELTRLAYMAAFSGAELTEDKDMMKHWSPLTDDAAALRLAVELQLGISVPPVSDMRVEVVTFYGPTISIVEYPKDNDRCAATRRVIVRCAAEAGKGMK